MREVVDLKTETKEARGRDELRARNRGEVRNPLTTRCLSYPSEVASNPFTPIPATPRNRSSLFSSFAISSATFLTSFKSSKLTFFQMTSPSPFSAAEIPTSSGSDPDPNPSLKEAGACSRSPVLMKAEALSKVSF